MNNRENLKNNLLEHMIEIYVPEFIRDELWLYLPYYSNLKIEKMLSFSLYQFENWYDENDNPYNY